MGAISFLCVSATVGIGVGVGVSAFAPTLAELVRFQAESAARRGVMDLARYDANNFVQEVGRYRINDPDTSASRFSGLNTRQTEPTAASLMQRGRIFAAAAAVLFPEEVASAHSEYHRSEFQREFDSAKRWQKTQEAAELKEIFASLQRNNGVVKDRELSIDMLSQLLTAGVKRFENIRVDGVTLSVDLDNPGCFKDISLTENLFKALYQNGHRNFSGANFENIIFFGNEIYENVIFDDATFKDCSFKCIWDSYDQEITSKVTFDDCSFKQAKFINSAEGYPIQRNAKFQNCSMNEASFLLEDKDVGIEIFFPSYRE